MVQGWWNHWKTINDNGASEKKHDHPIVMKKWPSTKSRLFSENIFGMFCGNIPGIFCENIPGILCENFPGVPEHSYQPNQFHHHQVTKRNSKTNHKLQILKLVKSHVDIALLVILRMKSVKRIWNKGSYNSMGLIWQWQTITEVQKDSRNIIEIESILSSVFTHSPRNYIPLHLCCFLIFVLFSFSSHPISLSNLSLMCQ